MESKHGNGIKRRMKQAGTTLMEIIMWLAIAGVIVGGALALSGMSTSSNNAISMLRDITGMQTAIKGLYYGQGGYGAVSMNGTLITANKVPSTWSVSGTTITHQLNGTVTATGATSTYTIAVTALPVDVCTQLMTNAGTGWISVQANAGTVRTPPVAPATAASDCATAPNTLTFTGN